MKKLMTIILTMILCSLSHGQTVQKSDSTTSDSTASVVAAASEDSVNLSKMIQAQIADALMKQSLERINFESSSTPHTYEIIVKDASLDFWTAVLLGLEVTKRNLFGWSFSDAANSLETTTEISADTWTKLFILAGFTFFILGGLYIKRKIGSTKLLKKRTLKVFVNMIREEKPFKKRNAKLSSLRNNLLNDPVNLKIESDLVTKRAKELSIAKGELLLAARIKSYELMKAWSPK